jgi:hypothetical protein
LGCRNPTSEESKDYEHDTMGDHSLISFRDSVEVRG